MLLHSLTIHVVPCLVGPSGSSRPWTSPCTRMQMAADGRASASQSATASVSDMGATAEGDATAYVPVEVPNRRYEDGTPMMRLIPEDEASQPLLYNQALSEAEMLRDVHRITPSRPADAASSSMTPVQVPAQRITAEPAELDLIGEGLPIIRGVRRLQARMLWARRACTRACMQAYHACKKGMHTWTGLGQQIRSKPTASTCSKSTFR